MKLGWIALTLVATCGSFPSFGSVDGFVAEPARSQPAGELIERTLAIVGGQVITLTDLQTTLALGLVDGVDTRDPIGSATPKLVDRLLVLREVQRYAPPEPADAAIADRLAQLRQHLSPEVFARTLEAGGFTEARLRAWIRDDLRIAAYLRQRFAAAGVPTDEDVSAYFNRRRDEFEKTNTAFEQAVPIIRERLADERRSELIDDWIAELRRRTAVVELWRTKN